MEKTVLGLTVCFLLTAGAWDLFHRRIPNSLTISTALLALLISTLRGTSFLLPSLKGLAFGLGLGLLPFSLRMMGGGDVKSLGALGALIGAPNLWAAFLGALAAGGVFGVLLLLSPHAHRRCKGRAEAKPQKRMAASFSCRFISRESIPFTALLALAALTLMALRV